jgi:putative membrane protein
MCIGNSLGGEEFGAGEFMTMHDLPAVNATLNGLSAIFLLIGYVNLKRKQIELHRNCMIGAFCTSVLFLICYITYHTYMGVILHQGPTVFRDPPWFRKYYLALLLSHTILAVIIVPMVIVSLKRGLKRKDELHKKIAKWTWPIWMYVSVTGVLVYLILYQIFPQR